MLITVLSTVCGVNFQGDHFKVQTSGTKNPSSEEHTKPFLGQVERIPAKNVSRVLTEGFKVPIYWNTALGINNIGYYSAEFAPVDGWGGKLQGSAFEIAVYKSYKPLFGNPPLHYYAVDLMTGKVTTN